MIVLTLQSATLDDMRRELDTALGQVRALVPSTIEVAAELRLDLLDFTSNLETFVRSAPIPLVATARRVREGGAFGGDEGTRRKLLSAAKHAGCRFIDVEWPDAVEMEVAPDDRIVSWHVRDVAPRFVESEILELRRVPAARRKLVFEPSSLTDLAEIERLATDPNLGAVFGMGELGRISRFRSLERTLAGEGFTYLGANDKRAAPGQIVTAELLRHAAFVQAAIDRRKIAYLGLLGWPTAHSISPDLFRILAEREGIPLVYAPLPVASVTGLEDFLSAFGIRGLSITAPHKSAVLRELKDARSDDQSRSIGAVNTLIRDAEGRIELANFDVDGIEESLLRRRDLYSGNNCLVIGAGGAARAACAALQRMGFHTYLWARDRDAARELASELAVRPSIECEEGPFDVVVNATGAGRFRDDLEVPSRVFDGARVAFEMSYLPSETKFAMHARRAGASIIGGIEMFEIQAAKQWKRFVPQTSIVPHEVALAARRVLSAREAGGGA